MAGQNGGRHTTHQSLAVTLVLGCLFPTLTCFNLKRAGNSVEHKAGDVAAALEVRTGRITVNGKDLKCQSVSAAQTREPTSVDSYHLEGPGVSEWTLELEDPTASEAILKQMNVSLQCGENTMTLKATGPRAADLELDTGDSQPMLLTEMPETCGHSVQQNAQCLILVVSTMGCNVMKENGTHVFSIRWLDTPVNLTCPIHPTPEAQSALATSDPAEKTGKPNHPHKLWNMYPRKRRHVKHYDLDGFGKPVYPIFVTQAPATTVSTPAGPHQMPPFPSQYSPYYYYHYYHHPYYSYYPYYYHQYFQHPKESPPTPTTTPHASTSTPMVPQKSPNLCDPYLPGVYPFPTMRYCDFMQHCYGKRPYIVPTNEIPTTQLPFYTLGPSPTMTVPTTRRISTTTPLPIARAIKQCKFIHPAGNHRIVKSYEPYQEKPFDLFFSENFNHADNTDKGKYMPEAVYTPTDYSQAKLYPGVQYLPPVPWLPQEP